MAKQKSRKTTSQKRKTTSGLSVPVVSETKEELHFAIVAASAASRGQTPRQSFASKSQEAKDKGRLDSSKGYLFLTDHPMNHMAFAIMDSFPEKRDLGEKKQQALLWRALFAYADVARDARFQQYIHSKDGEHFIEEAILEALATIPMSAGQEVPRDEIFELVSSLMNKGDG